MLSFYYTLQKEVTNLPNTTSLFLNRIFLKDKTLQCVVVFINSIRICLIGEDEKHEYEENNINTTAVFYVNPGLAYLV